MSAAPGVAPARSVAYAVLRRVFEQDAWADRALRGEADAAGLEPRDRALAVALVYGAVQRRDTLDHVIGTLARRPADELDPPILAALRLGVLQLLFLDRVPAHAAVDQSVRLAKHDAPRGAGLVNAVLRRAGREGPRLLGAIRDPALRHSHPRWIAELWTESLGADAAAQLMERDNEPAESALRVNALRATAAEVAAELPVAARPAGPDLPEGLVLEGAWDAFADPGWVAGRFMPQSRAAMAVARVLDPQPGERVLDLCAAPGAKTTHLAALMGDAGAVDAVELHPGRAEALRRTAARMGATSVTVHIADAATFPATGYDRVLVDPPCSDLGTLQSRPDVRWRKQPGDPARLAALQQRILAAGAAATRPGGVLVYSTCTISPAENEEVVAAFLAERTGWSADDLRADRPTWEHPRVPLHLQTLPHRDGTEGFFIARLRRAA